MSWAAARRVLSWIAPEGVLLAAAVVALQLTSLREAVREFAQFYPYVVFGLGALLALRFQRSRLVFALLLLALAEWGLGHAPKGAAGRFMLQAAAALLPLNLAAVTLMTERGTFTRPGLVRLAVVFGQVGLLLLVARTAPAKGAAIAGHRFLPAEWFNWTPLAQPPVLAFVLAGALMGAGVAFLGSPTGRAFLWALLATFLGLHAYRTPAAGSIYLATAGLILAVAVIEASYLMAYQDGLTGLPARRALNEALQRIDGRYAVAMVDIDHFKKLNDHHGHDVGDQVLRMVGAQLAEVSGGGRAFRYGGEEFALIFSGKGVEECLPNLEALRQTIEGTRFTVRRRLRPRRKPTAPAGGGRGSRRVAVTVSIGVAESTGRHRTADAVIQAADRALYRAKDAGRNRVKT